tara:strand:+ start:1237 stop:1413 length:177 start_codon:yes stop_codon:yes gene_type:complete
MNRKTVSEGMDSDSEGRVPYSLNQRMDVSIHRLAAHGEHALIAPTRVLFQITGDPIEQ